MGLDMLFMICMLLSAEQLEAKKTTSAPRKGHTDSSGKTFATNYEEIGNSLLKTLEEFKHEMKTGIPWLKIPVIDPLYISNVNQSIDVSLANASFLLKDIYIVGLSDFTITELKIGISKHFVNISLGFPKLQVHGFNDIKGKVLKTFNIKSKGNFSVVVKELLLSGRGHFQVPQGKDGNQEKAKMRIDYINFDYSVGNVKANFKGINKIMLNMILKTLTGDGFRKMAMGNLNKMIMDMINQKMDHL